MLWICWVHDISLTVHCHGWHDDAWLTSMSRDILFRPCSVIMVNDMISFLHCNWTRLVLMSRDIHSLLAFAFSMVHTVNFHFMSSDLESFLDLALYHCDWFQLHLTLRDVYLLLMDQDHTFRVILLDCSCKLLELLLNLTLRNVWTSRQKISGIRLQLLRGTLSV